MFYKMGFSTYYWRMIDPERLRSNFFNYLKIDSYNHEIFDILTYEYVPFLELGMILLFNIPFLIIYLNLNKRHLLYYKEDWILYRFDFFNRFNLGLRRLLTLYFTPLVICILLTPLLISFAIIYIYIFEEYDEYNEPQIFGLLCIYGSLALMIGLYAIFGFLGWIYNGFFPSKSDLQ